MIVSICCALLALRQDPTTAAPARAATPGKLISQAFQHYADASSLGGHIRLTQSAQNVTGKADDHSGAGLRASSGISPAIRRALIV